MVYVSIGAFYAAAIVLWIYAFRDLGGTSTFGRGSKIVWFWIILMGPIGAIAYLSAKKSVEKYSHPDAVKLARLLKEEK